MYVSFWTIRQFSPSMRWKDFCIGFSPPYSYHSHSSFRCWYYSQLLTLMSCLQIWSWRMLADPDRWKCAILTSATSKTRWNASGAACRCQRSRCMTNGTPSTVILRVESSSACILTRTVSSLLLFFVCLKKPRTAYKAAYPAANCEIAMRLFFFVVLMLVWWVRHLTDPDEPCTDSTTIMMKYKTSYHFLFLIVCLCLWENTNIDILHHSKSSLFSPYEFSLH